MILENKQIFLDENLSTKDTVMSFIAEKSKLLGITDDENGLYQKLWEREKEYPTAVLDLIAIPHVKSDLIKTSKLLFIRLTDAVDWDSPDGFKVKSVFVILVPEKDAGQKHLEILSKVAVSLLEEDFQSMIMNMKTGDELIKYIKENLDGDLL
ncbi:PTS sugar transporter subunit IIA [Sebaldella sp. S0638]|uniref:PTS sugar transporter subunit IIA n=1 Tax=Sebaldella sp. S0638 TaxID=2957809 RepID=UPI00209CC51B|nr:PTS sugar transporter subunit IIA [Sebaldella sp. S0638]MCP1224222.1 PTS sugar transporter subunit IIA [Sebaldella sp. S0638]